MNVVSYRKISVRDEVYRKLLEIKREKGFTNISDTIAFLLEFYATLGSKIDALHATLSSIVNSINMLPAVANATSSSMEKNTDATSGSMAHATQGSIEKNREQMTHATSSSIVHATQSSIEKNLMGSAEKESEDEEKYKYADWTMAFPEYYPQRRRGYGAKRQKAGKEEKPYEVVRVSDADTAKKMCEEAEKSGYLCNYRQVNNKFEVFKIDKGFLEKIVSWLNERQITLAQIAELSGEYGTPARLAHEFGLIIKTSEGWRIV